MSRAAQKCRVRFRVGVGVGVGPSYIAHQLLTKAHGVTPVSAPTLFCAARLVRE